MEFMKAGGVVYSLGLGLFGICPECKARLALNKYWRKREELSDD